MDPKKVNPSNFKVESILFDNDYFSIAFGNWENSKEFSIAMRWNGNDGGDVGYPKLFKNPVWFLIHNDLRTPIVKCLLELECSENDLIIKALSKLID